ncbi:MAG: hypothetical protein FWD55_05915 [Propionibacteriaceae bacterium]|nr:hypothetical protein [Propionibacteriaceae bacterium]
MGLKKVIAGLAAIVVLLGAGGCSVNLPTAAAVVNGVVITEESLAIATAAFNETLGADPSFANVATWGGPFLLQHRIRGLIADGALAELGVDITDQDRNDFWNYYYGSQSQGSAPHPIFPMLEDPRTQDFITGYIDFEMMRMMYEAGYIDADGLVKRLESAQVTMNPRYGEFDAQYLTQTSFYKQGQSSPKGSMAIPFPFSMPA